MEEDQIVEAKKALDAYFSEWDAGKQIDYKDKLENLLCDLMHFAKANNINFGDCMEYAERHFNGEGGNIQ